MSCELLLFGRDELRRKAVPVADIDDDLRILARDMLDTMYAQNGLGLAAEQVGRTEAMFVVDVPPRQDVDPETGERVNPGVVMPIVAVNPVLSDPEGKETREEGCLSFPEIYVPIERAAAVTLSFTDLDGREESVRAKGLLARAIQHEMDHLDGVLLVDRMTPVQRVAVAGKLKRLRKASARKR